MTDAEAFDALGIQAFFAGQLILPAAALWLIRDPRWLCVCHLATRGVLMILFGVLLLGTVPRFRMILIGFGTELPGVTIMVFDLSELFVTQLPFVLLFGLVGIAAEAVQLERLLASKRQAVFARFVSFLVTCGSVFVLLCCELAIAMAFIKVDDSLQ